jgi:hypothetical protein
VGAFRQPAPVIPYRVIPELDTARRARILRSFTSQNDVPASRAQHSPFVFINIAIAANSGIHSRRLF